MDLLPLSIFPPGGLDSSVITTVWVGVFIVAFFNLRFGWVLSGLVVPGYLVPLLIAKPLAAGVVVFEAILTYLLVVFVAGPLARIQGWSSFFGRDRFFALVLVSVVVRLVLDAWLLVTFGEWLVERHDIVFDYRSNLHSFGLIIIALMANQFWKTGLARGLVPLVVTVGLTWLIVRFGLMELTNFRISGLSYMFEDVTASIMAGPKAYIILLTTAFIASRMNLFYGWEFNGILIPSLLALQWYEPGKILVSFLEAFLILGIGSALLRLPILRNANIEGARKLLLFFNISFAWKMLLSYGLVELAPGMKVSDYFAFGYLLSTLMAIKMHDKAIAIRLTWTTLATSAVAIVAASTIGFALTLVPTGSSLDVATASSARIQRLEAARLDTLIATEKRRLYAGIGTWIPPLGTELEAFRSGIAIIAGLENVDDPRLPDASARLAQAGYEVVVVADRHLLIRETELRGWGTYVITPDADADLLVSVPAPLHERGTTEAGLWLRSSTDARALALGGPRRRYGRDANVALLTDPRSPFLAFHAGAVARDAVQIRGYGESLRRSLPGIGDDDGAGGTRPDLAWLSDELPKGLNLGRLQDRIGSLEVRFEALPATNRVRERHTGDFAELVLSQRGLRRMAAGLSGVDEVEQRVSEQRLEGWLEDWLFGETKRIAPRGSGAYQAPDLYELLFFDEEILTPALAILDQGHVNGRWTADGEQRLADLATRLAPFGYRLLRYRHRHSGSDYLILGRRDDASGRYWGTFVFRAGRGRPYVVQVPRPEYEAASFEFGLHLFDRLQASAFMVAGAHPYANLDGSSDITRASNARSLFSLVSQVLLREAGEARTVVQARALGFGPDRPPPAADVLFAVGRGTVPAAELDAGVRLLLAELRSDGLELEAVDGDAGESGLEATGSYQSRYVDAAPNASFVQLWLSPLVRADFSARGEDRRLLRDAEALGLTIEEVALTSWLDRRTPVPWQPDAETRALVERYARSRDIVALVQLASTQPRPPSLIIDIETRRAFLALHGETDVRAVAALAAVEDVEDVVVEVSRDTVPDAALERLHRSRARWLRFVEAVP